MEGSLNVPTRRITRCGRAFDALVTGVPHVEQNPRVIVFPDAAFETNVDSLPSIEIAAVSTTAFTVAEPAAQYWQSRHQH